MSEIREPHPNILKIAGVTGRWRWRNLDEKMTMGDICDFREPEPQLYQPFNPDRPFRPVRESEVGYVVMPDEEHDVLSPLDPVVAAAFDEFKKASALELAESKQAAQAVRNGAKHTVDRLQLEVDVLRADVEYLADCFWLPTGAVREEAARMQAEIIRDISERDRVIRDAGLVSVELVFEDPDGLWDRCPMCEAPGTSDVTTPLPHGFTYLYWVSGDEQLCEACVKKILGAAQ